MSQLTEVKEVREVREVRDGLVIAGKTFLSRCHALARFRANAPGETTNENSGSKTSNSKTRANAPERI